MMVEALYQEQIRPLSLAERVQLVQLIMADIAAATPRWTIDYNDAWNDEDLTDLTRASLVYLSKTSRDDNNAAYNVDPR